MRKSYKKTRKNYLGGNNRAYPNRGPPIGQNTIFNNSSSQHGGTCGACSLLSMKGGNCGCGLSMKGGIRSRGGRGKKGWNCKIIGGKKHKKKQFKGGNAGIPYPNGLVGSPLTQNSNGWPGIDGIPGNRNYYAPNPYDNQIIPTPSNNNFQKGGKSKKQKGGTLSNFIAQDLINLGRQFQFGVGTAYNALAGQPSPVNPLPFKGQFSSNNQINTRL